jgi:uncharacterized protein (TIGR03382 family)
MTTVITTAVTTITVALAAGRVEGAEVERVRSYWNADKTTIYSDVIVTNDEGTKECRRELGGTVDGIGQIRIALYEGDLTVDYVPTVASSGAHLHWAGSCVFITPSSRGTTNLAFSDVMAALTASTNEWNDVAGSCGYLRFMIEDSADVDARKDGKNVLVFREDHWARGGSSDPDDAYKSAATAITTLSFIDDASRQDNGTILDTDIEMNAINFGFAVGCEAQCRTMSTKDSIEDLQNTLTHELGHVIGLSHTCFIPDNQHMVAPLDDEGQPAPACILPNLPSVITDATMYPFQGPREITKRSLTQDDVNGACANYPVASDPGVCEPADLPKSGCTATGMTGGSPAAVMVAASILWARRRRRQGTSL